MSEQNDNNEMDTEIANNNNNNNNNNDNDKTAAENLKDKDNTQYMIENEPVETFYDAALNRLIMHCLFQVGFTSASPRAVAEMHEQLLKRIGAICNLSKSYATLYRRTKPTASDFDEALSDLNESYSGIKQIYNQNKKVGQLDYLNNILHLEPRSHFREESYLSAQEVHQSKDEIGASPFFPALPPPHTYKIDTTSSRKDAEDQSAALDARIKTSRLIEKSLQNLLAATDSVATSNKSKMAKKQTQSQTGSSGNGGSSTVNQQDQSTVSITSKQAVSSLTPGFESLSSSARALLSDTQIARDLAIVNFEKQWFKRPLWLTGSTILADSKASSAHSQNSVKDDSTGLNDYSMLDMGVDGVMVPRKKRVKRWRVL